MPEKKSRKKSKKKAKKKPQFKTITLKVSARQKRSLTNYCKARHLTPNKLIKKCLRPFLEHYAELETEPRKKEKVRQLELF